MLDFPMAQQLITAIAVAFAFIVAVILPGYVIAKLVIRSVFGSLDDAYEESKTPRRIARLLNEVREIRCGNEYSRPTQDD